MQFRFIDRRCVFMPTFHSIHIQIIFYIFIQTFRSQHCIDLIGRNFTKKFRKIKAYIFFKVTYRTKLFCNFAVENLSVV